MEKPANDWGEAGRAPVKIWMPQSGPVRARIPARPGNRRWLRRSVGVRSPALDGEYWILPRGSVARLLTAAVDRFGLVALWRDMATLLRCTRVCLEASGADCQCSCMGVHHGENSLGWVDVRGEAVVKDLGAYVRAAVVYGPARATTTDPQLYDGCLDGVQYRADRGGRAGWPRAAAFMCSSCLAVRAEVWDHCHIHGYVRAPLCTRCNTRRWKGWDPAFGRARNTEPLNLDHYARCPRHDPDAGNCSS